MCDILYFSIENDKKYNGLLDIMNTHIQVSSDGNHSWNALVMLRMSCGMDIKDFPFDTQICPLRFGSLSMDSTKLDMDPLPVGLAQYGGKN